PIRAMLSEDGVATNELPLKAERRYVIEGVCDGDCDDVDIVVRNAAGDVVASDRADDDEPVVEFVPEASGRYVVSVVLASCSTSSCEVGANVFIRHRQPTDASRADVDGRLAQITTVLAQRSWNRAAAPVVYGVAEEGVTELGTFLLTAGRTYQVAGVCDEDCDDLDLRVMGPGAERLGTDDETDDTPLVGFTAPVTGAYHVGATMADCETETCVFAVAVYEGGSSSSASSGSSSTSASTSTSTASSTNRRPECAVAGARESIVVGEVRRGDLAAATCRFRDSNAVYYRLQVTSAQRITFDLTGTGMDPYLTLLDDRGTQLAENDDGGGDRAARLAHDFSPGTYYVVARGLATTTSGQYTLSAR
ncbi:MAG TPA: hypothetical protein VFO66_15465, partial [Gemmatimonadaceae bacterium]|nr:hypothetical protein [Gemmatimonadaceae bacterium]